MIVKNKYSGEQYVELKDTSIEEAKNVLRNAKKAFQVMKDLPSFERYESLLKVSRELENRREEFAKIISNEAGKPIKYSRGEARRASITMLFSAEESKRIYGETIPMDVESRGRNRFA
jgi:NAD-dependent aldehyde dehydrogenases